MGQQISYKVLLLAGYRSKPNEITTAYQTRYKALAPIAGQPMIMHPLNCLQNSEHISEIIVLSQEPENIRAALKNYQLSDKVKFQVGQNSIADTILDLWRKQPSGQALLITTTDNCLLRIDDIDHFLTSTEALNADIYIGMVEKSLLLASHPESQRTWIRFSDTEVTGCNLYLLKGRHAEQAIQFWNKFESSPKNIMKFAWSLGPLLFSKYLLHKLSIENAFTSISDVAGARLRYVFMPNPEVCIDADKLSDIEQIERILGHHKK